MKVARRALECGGLLPLSIGPACWPAAGHEAAGFPREQARVTKSGGKPPHSKGRRGDRRNHPPLFSWQQAAEPLSLTVFAHRLDQGTPERDTSPLPPGTGQAAAAKAGGRVTCCRADACVGHSAKSIVRRLGRPRPGQAPALHQGFPGLRASALDCEQCNHGSSPILQYCEQCARNSPPARGVSRCAPRLG